jgi:hypothetical protein
MYARVFEEETHLVAQTLSTARWHQAEHVFSTKCCTDRFDLMVPEPFQLECFLENTTHIERE